MRPEDQAFLGFLINNNVQDIGQQADAVGWSTGALPVGFSAYFSKEGCDGHRSHTCG